MQINQKSHMLAWLMSFLLLFQCIPFPVLAGTDLPASSDQTVSAYTAVTDPSPDDPGRGITEEIVSSENSALLSEAAQEPVREEQQASGEETAQNEEQNEGSGPSEARESLESVTPRVGYAVIQDGAVLYSDKDPETGFAAATRSLAYIADFETDAENRTWLYAVYAEDVDGKPVERAAWILSGTEEYLTDEQASALTFDEDCLYYTGNTNVRLPWLAIRYYEKQTLVGLNDSPEENVPSEDSEPTDSDLPEADPSAVLTPVTEPEEETGRQEPGENVTPVDPVQAEEPVIPVEPVQDEEPVFPVFMPEETDNPDQPGTAEENQPAVSGDDNLEEIVPVVPAEEQKENQNDDSASEETEPKAETDPDARQELPSEEPLPEAEQATVTTTPSETESSPVSEEPSQEEAQPEEETGTHSEEEAAQTEEISAEEEAQEPSQEEGTLVPDLTEETEVLTPVVEEEAEETGYAEPGSFVRVTAGCASYSEPEPDLAESSGPRSGVYAGSFGREAIAEVSEVLEDEQGVTWYRLTCVMADVDYATGEVRWSEEYMVWVPADDVEPVDLTEKTFVDLHREKLASRRLMAIGPSNNYPMSTGYLTEGTHLTEPMTNGIGTNSFRADSGHAYVAWYSVEDGKNIYVNRYFNNSYAGTLAYSVYCITPTQAQPPTGSTGFLKYNYSSQSIYDARTHTALRWLLRNGYPFRVYQGNAQASMISTQAAIRQVVIDLAGVNKPEDDMSSRTYVATETGTTITAQNSETYLNYAKWLAAKAEEASSYSGAITFNPAHPTLTRSGDTYTSQQIQVNISGDYARVAKSNQYTITGDLVVNDNSWPVSTRTVGYSSNYYYIAPYAKITVTTTNPNMSIYFESCSMANEVGLCELNTDRSGYQTLSHALRESQLVPMSNATLRFGSPVGTCHLTKTDDKTPATPLPGAVFTLVSKDGTTYNQKRTTDSNGIALWENVPVGEYVLTEVTPPSGYVSEMPSCGVVIRENLVTAPKIKNKKNEIKGTIRVNKKRADGLSNAGKVLSGAVFALYNSSGTKVGDNVTTNASGVAEFTNVPAGTYTLREVTAPTGYRKAADQSVTVSENGKVYIKEVKETPVAATLRIEKVRAGTSTKLAGAKYEILASDGKTKAKDIYGNTLPDKTTDASGVATWSNVEYGTYYVYEIAAPAGYVLDGTKIAVSVQSGNDQGTVTKAISNTPIKGKIRVIKKSASGESISGCVFSVKEKSSGKVVATLTTGSNGQAVTGDLEYGDYIVRETSAPERWVLNQSDFPAAIRTNGSTVDVNVTNQEAKGYIAVTKKDSLDQTKLKDVTFEVYNSANKLVATMVTNADGYARSAALDPGKYTVKEKAVPNGYVNTLATSSNVAVTATKTTDLSFTNTPIQAKVRIVKTDSVTSKPLPGAVFEVVRISGLPSHNGSDNNKVVATLTTDSNGVAETGSLTWGTYEVRETRVPDKYVDKSFKQQVSLTENGKTYTINVSNEPEKGKIRITKKDTLDGGKIAGVVVEVYDSNGRLAATVTTDANGSAVTPALDDGTYTVKEKSVPAGYVNTPDEKSGVQVSRQTTTDVELANTPIRAKVKILKRDGLNQVPLEGAEFEIVRVSGIPARNGAGNGDVAARITTGSDGTAVTSDLTYGKYMIRESKVPDKYQDLQYSSEIILSENGKTYEVTVDNTPKPGKIRVKKTDSLSGKPIEGVPLEIYDAKNELVDTILTGADGYAVSKDLPRAKYTVREKTNPTGYVADLAEKSDVQVMQAETTDIELKNQPIRGRICIQKTDGITNEPLKGAEFTVIRKSGIPTMHGEGDGETVAVITTDENGFAQTGLLTFGTYEVVETKVPEHFVDNHWKQEVTVEDDSRVYTLQAVNEPTKGRIRVVKKDSLNEKPLADIQFDILDGKGETVATMTTDRNGEAVSAELTKGVYTVREHEMPEGYTGELAENKHVIVRSDETTDVSFVNRPIQGRIRIQKTDELTGEALAGAEFTVVRKSGISRLNGYGDGETVAVITTNEKGIAETGLLTWGTYEIRETKVPAHYVDNNWSETVQIREENRTYAVQVENEPTKGQIRLVKTDGETEYPIAGIVFDIYENDEYGKGYVTSMTTGEDGVAESIMLRKGNYIVKEHGGTAGYVFDEVTLRDVKVQSDLVTELQAENRHVNVRIRISKRDADLYKGENPNCEPDADIGESIPERADISAPEARGDAVLTGAVFQVRAAEDILLPHTKGIIEKGTVVADNLATDGENASVVTEELWPGLYEIRELKAPEGYQPSREIVYVDTRTAGLQSEKDVVVYDALKTNEVMTARLILTKMRGTDTVHSNPEVLPQPEEDAEFRVWLKSAGSYEDALDDQKDILKTDENGRAASKPLPYGTYVLEQTRGDEHYEMIAPMEFEIISCDDIVMTLNNYAIQYRLRLIKMDEETGKTLIFSHATFQLEDEDGNAVTQVIYAEDENGNLVPSEVDRFTTDVDGTVTLPETLLKGTYYIHEIEAPDGYLALTDRIRVDIGNEDDSSDKVHLVDVMIDNTPVKGRIVLEKTGLQLTGFETETDSWGQTVRKPVCEEKYLEGAVFEIRAAEVIEGMDGTVWYNRDQLADTIVTTSSGNDRSKDLPLGRYYLVETKAPEGYVFEDTRYEADLTYRDDSTARVEFVVEARNDYLPMELTLDKTKETTQVNRYDDGTVRTELVNIPGDGFVFGMYNRDEITWRDENGNVNALPAGSLVATGETNASGRLTFGGYYPHGVYYVQEIGEAAVLLGGLEASQWKLNTNRYYISLTKEQNNPRDNVIRARLSQKIANELNVSRITLTKRDITGKQTIPGALIEVRNEQGIVIYRAVTDANGEIPNIPVTPGKYTFQEILAPEGYALNVAVMSFTVNEDGTITGDREIRDDYTRVTFLKQDAEGKPLQGVEFTLFRADGQDEKAPVFTAVSDAEGRVTFEKIPFGSFVVRETRPLPGYIPNGSKILLSVDGTFVNPEGPVATLTNRLNMFTVKKVDQDGKPLQGGEFTAYRDDGTVAATAVSDADGLAVFRGMPYGHYTVRETRAPAGYLMNRGAWDITIDEQYRNTSKPIATVVNRFKQVRYIKKDTSGKFLEGVEFSLINAATGEVTETVLSDANGVFTFHNFDYGDWIIRETRKPEQYCQMEDVYLHVDDLWTEPEPVTCINIPNHYEFVKTDNLGNPLAGVKFSLEDEQGNQLGTYVSGDDGIVRVTDLKPGTYIIREIEAAAGYVLSEEVIRVVIDEHYVVPAEMYRLVNYPVIQTGVEFHMTPVMWGGAFLMLLAGATAVIFTAKGKKKPEDKAEVKPVDEQKPDTQE